MALGYAQGMGGFDPQMLQALKARMGGNSGMMPPGTGFGAQNLSSMMPGSPGGYGNMVGGMPQPQVGAAQMQNFGGGFNPQSLGGTLGSQMMQKAQPQMMQSAGAAMNPNLMNRPGMQDPRNRRARGY